MSDSNHSNDATELKRENQALKVRVAELERAASEREERIHHIVENVQDLMYRMRLPDGKYEYVSPAATALTGYAPEEWYAEPLLVRRLISPEWAERFATAWDNLLRGDLPASFEYPIIDRSGRKRWFHQRNTLVRNEEGQPIAIVGVVSDVSERKYAEDAIKESEASVRKKLDAIIAPDGDMSSLTLIDIVDVDAIRQLMEEFSRITDMAGAMLDVSGKVLVSTGWKDICMKFHRVHPETGRNCLESDTILSEGIAPGAMKFYRCKNNLWDVASPIMFGGRHVGNLFLGQFFLEDTELDYGLFREQARRYGFDEEAYLAALDRVPRLTREKANAAMSFFARLSGMVSELTSGNVRLARSLSEKERLLEDLRASEERFRSFVENANDVIYSLSPDGVFTYVSPNWTEALGHDVREVVGRSFVSFVHPGDLAACHEFLEQVLATGKSLRGAEYRVRHKDGSWRWHESSASRVYNPDGRVFFMGIARDITEQKRFEDALMFLAQCGNVPSGEDFFQALARYLSENLEMDYVCIDRLCEGSLSAKTLAVYNCGRFDQNVEYTLRDTPCGKVVGRAVCCFPSGVRHLFPLDLALQELEAESYIGTTLWGSQGLPIGLIAVIGRRPLRNAHLAESILKLAGVRASGELERRYMEDALLREKALTDAILDSTPGIIYMYDDQNRLVRWNRMHEELTGYSSEELYGKNLLDWYTGDEASLASITEGIKRTIERGFGDAEAELQRKDGVGIPMYFTASPLVFDGRTYFVGIGIDISERRRADEERERLQTQLLQAQKMEAVGHLAGGIAHDFNNLLQVILGNVDLLLDEDAAGQDELKEVQKAAQRAAELTGQLLAFGRRQIMQPITLDLNDLVQSILKMLRRVIGEHIEIVFMPGDRIGTVYADKGQIEQVVMNLCVNARDAMARGGTLTLATRRARLDADFCREHPWASEGDFTVVSIADTGHGMDAETRARIFEPFFTTKEIGKGSGLGLATVYGIVKQHNGLVAVLSEPENGTLFEVFLPVIAETQLESLHEDALVPAVGGTETILVAEDDPPVLKLIAWILRDAGYSVLTTPDGKEALRVFEENADSIRLVILDVMMPGLSGRETMNRIQAGHDGVLFLFSSGYSENAIHTDFVIDEGLSLVQKPYRRDVLLREVRRILDAPAAPDPPASIVPVVGGE